MSAIAIPRVTYWGKLPVPFVAAWSSEITIRIEPDPVIGGRPALFRSGRRKDGTPKFGKMDESRVRFVMAQRRCQVCAESLRGVGYVVDTIKGSVGRDPLLSEPLACLRCFRVAVALCPGIPTLRESARAIVVRCTSYDLIAATVAPFEGGDPELNAALAFWHGEPPVGYTKFAPREYELLPMAWLDSADARGAA
jgi:hypothetical protein